MDDPSVVSLDRIETVEPLEHGQNGALYPESGIALVCHEGRFYLIQLNHDESKAPFHELTTGELRRLHLYNLHLDKSRRVLTPQEIEGPPFTRLIEQLKIEKELASCEYMLDIFLDPLERDNTELRFLAAETLEGLLEAIAKAKEMLREKLRRFIPPEGYTLRPDELFAASSLMNTPFREKFPRLCALLENVQDKWMENSERYADKRLTRQGIQEHHDETALIASENLLRRAKETVETLRQALADLSHGGNPESWMMTWGPGRQLSDAKGQLQVLPPRLPKDKERFEDTEVRVPGLMARWEESAAFLKEAEALLPQVEKLLGTEIKATRFIV